MKSEIDIETHIRQDLFDAIRYEKRQNSHGPATGLQLSAHFVFKWIFKDAWSHISVGVTKVNPYKYHSTKSLFNDAAAWEGHETSTRIALGRCLVYFVREGMLPLECGNPDANNLIYAVTVR